MAAAATARSGVGRVIWGLIGCAAWLAAVCPVLAQQATGLGEIRAALQSRQYGAAVSHADGYLATNPKDNDGEALYLKAVAQYHDGKHAEAAATAQQVVDKHAEGPWATKAKFLKAQSLIALKQFEPAEAIYAEQSRLLLSNARKHEIAGLLVRFADALATTPDPNDVGAPPPNYQKAYKLYGKALEMEIGRDLRDEVMFKRAAAIAKAGEHGQAVNDFQAYLDAFDPTWTGPVGSTARMQGRKRENPPPAGKHVFEARYELARNELDAGMPAEARINAEDLLLLLNGDGQEVKTLAADAAWLIVRTYQMPDNESAVVDRAIKSANDYLRAHPAHRHSVEAAWLIAATYHQNGRYDEAAAAYEAFIAATHYKLPAGEAATQPLEPGGQSPAQLADEYQKLAVYQIGTIRFEQKQYAAAIEQWQRYVNRFPNGPHWADSQRQIIDAQFMIAIDAVSDGKHDEARGLFAAFMSANPLDDRVRQALFTLGQMRFAEAKKLDDAKGDREATRQAYQQAVDQWQQLVSKYPDTEESSLALYRAGMVLEEQLGDLEKALDAYRRLTWGSWASHAQQRVAQMTRKHLELVTPRTYRTNEPASVTLHVRNMEKLTIRQYHLDLEAYFRKTHSTTGVDSLDISLIEPAKTWEVTIEGYAKYKPMTQQVTIPFDDGKPGVCIIHVGDDELESTTLVIRSDIDVVVKSSRREMLAFVQNRVTGEPAKGVELLVSDGQSVFTTGITGDDGVWRAAAEPLQRIERIAVLAKVNGHVASNAIELIGLQFSTGLAAKGYIYTDRPAYQPGHEVRYRGVIRDVKDGSYAAPAGDEYLVSITDPQGRVVREVEAKLSPFGTFNSALRLDPAAGQGQYTITARRKTDESIAYAGHFLVEHFQLQKMRVKIDFPRNVYFRGETVEATITAEYYWGEPVSGKPVRYELPDGRSYVAQSDAKGQVTVRFDTAGLQAPLAMPFTAIVEGEDVAVTNVVQLARDGFAIKAETSSELVLAGEPFDVSITTTTPDGKPTGQALTVTVLRSEPVSGDPVLDAVPWISRPERPSAEVTVKTEKVATDPRTGKAVLRLSLEQGGQYTLRVAGVDRFEQTITGQTTVAVSGEEDATKLRFFADTDTLKVGEPAVIRLHSRLDGGLALLTIEGERIIAHQIVPLKKGYNDVKLAVDHEHYPNFRIAAVVMDGRDLREAAKPFRVQRELKVAVRPLSASYLPGAEGKVEITVTDQLGRPVKAELSLAMVDEALYAIFEDSTPDIQAFFQDGAERHAEFFTASSCGFEYRGVTSAVVKAVVDELARLERQQEMAQELAESLDAGVVENRLGALRGGELRRRMANGRAATGLQAGQWADPAAPPAPEADKYFDDATVVAGKKQAGASYAFDLVAPESRSGALFGDADEAATARVELPDAGAWLPDIVTDDAGKAVVTVPMPATTTQWRLTSRGISIETLVGQAAANVLTRKDFFVDIKAPRSLQEGDHVNVITRIHNLTDYAGPIELNLVVSSNGKRYYDLRTKAQIEKNSTSEVMFDPIEAPAALELKLEVTATAGAHGDGVARLVTVRPWGLEYADHVGGTATGDAAAFVELPGGMEYASRWLTVSIGPSVQQQVIDLALGSGYRIDVSHPDQAGHRPVAPPTIGAFAGGELLAAVSGLDYAARVPQRPRDYQQLVERARALVATLVTTQREDGGWAWLDPSLDSDDAVSAVSYWALNRARELGVKVHGETLTKAAAHLNNRFQAAGASDDDTKAVVLHALSTGNAADFAHVNRLYRQRNTLSAPALAYTALAFANLGRNEIAGELLDVLLQKSAPVQQGDRTLLRFEGSKNHPWLNDDVETTAVALLAMVRVRPQAPQAMQAAQWLLNVRGCFGYRSARARGQAVAGLAAWFGAGQFADTDAELAVAVNDKPLTTITAKGPQSVSLLAVPAELLLPGRNKVTIAVKGRAQYAYAATLRGFSAAMKDPQSFEYPQVMSRNYHHATLDYRGNPIAAASTSPVENLAIGQRTRVSVDMSDHAQGTYLIVEESLPAGTTLVPDSLKGNFKHHQISDSKITLYYPPHHAVGDYSYELAGYSTGHYRVLPTVVRDALSPGRMRLGKSGAMKVMPPGAQSPDPYVMNHDERFALGKAYFDDGLHQQAQRLLSELFTLKRNHEEREVARMLLWIHTGEGFYDAARIVEMFEVLRERYPELYIPFDRILTVAKAYHDLGEFERAYLVHRATIDASFLNDSNVSAILQDEGQLIGSVDYQHRLWRQYPDSADVAGSLFALSQLLYQQAPNAHLLAEERRMGPGTVGAAINAEGNPPPKPKLTKADLLQRAVRMLDDFMTLYPTSPLADDAAFSMANAFLDLKQYEAVVTLSGAFKGRYPMSDFAGGFQYMQALGHFWRRDYEPALQAAKVVADGEGKDRDFARYIIGQIHHAQGRPADAIHWYNTVRDQYPDARQAIDYFTDQRIALPEVTIVRPGEAAALKLDYRNIAEANVQVYRVDLMKLYLREKNLSTITQVNLAGIEPQLVATKKLGDGKDYADKQAEIALELKEEGAYLVICRGGDRFTSGLVLITPLKIEVQEDPGSGRLRANVVDAVTGIRPAGVHVKAIGSADQTFRSGDTDLRGLFIADGLNGTATVIARDDKARYAFYRGEQWHGPVPQNAGRTPPQAQQPALWGKPQQEVDYDANLFMMNSVIQQENLKSFESFRRNTGKGVQIQQAK